MTGNALRFGFVFSTVVVLTGFEPISSVARAEPITMSVQVDTVHVGMADAIARALDANPGLMAAAQRVRSTDRAAAAAYRQHFGDVEAVVWASRYQDAQILRPISRSLMANGFGGLPFAQDQLHYGLTFAVPLFVGGKLIAASHLARLKADEAGVLLEGTRWQIRANVTTLYASAQALAAVTAAYEENVASLEETSRRLRLMVEQGKRPEVDLLKATDAVEEARAQLADAQADLTHVTALLGAVLDYPTSQALDLDPLPDHVPALTEDSTHWSDLTDGASTVVAAGLRARQALSYKHVVRSEFLPKLSVRGNVLEHAASSVTGSQETWELTLAASIPLFTGGRRVAAYQSATAAEHAAKLALRQTRLQQEAEIHGALARLRAAETSLDAANRRVDAAVEAARIEGLRYDNGAGTIEDLLRARTRAAAAKAALAKAKGDVLGTSAQINALVEREIVR
jgi:outer membrane protein TolC